MTELSTHLTSLGDKYAPVTKHIQKRRKIIPWFSLEILVDKESSVVLNELGRSLVWQCTQKKDAVTCLVLKAKTDDLNSQVADSQTCIQLFSVTNSLLGKSRVSPLPTNIPAAQLPCSFCEFFTDKKNKKTKQIKQNLDNTPSPRVPTVVPDIATPALM